MSGLVGAQNTETEEELLHLERAKEAAKEVEAGNREKDSRTTYYDKWDQFAKVEVEKTENEEKELVEKANKDLGIDPSAPKSEAEKRDRAKHEALKEAKKQWEQKKEFEAAAKHLVTGHEDVTKVLDSSEIRHKPVLAIKSNKKSKFRIPGRLDHRLIKVFIDDCHDCHIELEHHVITQHLEISHCKNITVHVKAPLATLQADLCENLTIVYHEGLFHSETKVFHAGVKSLNLHTHEGLKHFADYIADGAVSEEERSAEEYQFMTTMVDGKIVTERVVRSKGNLPMTEREISQSPDDSIQSKERAAELKKIGGNEAFKEGEFAQAAVFYTEAIDLAPKGIDEETGKPISDIVHVCYANRAFCFQKLGQHDRALEDASKSVEIAPNYVKGLFRKGLALYALGRYIEAIQVLEQAQTLKPKDQQIKQAIGFAELRARGRATPS